MAAPATGAPSLVQERVVGGEPSVWQSSVKYSVSASERAEMEMVY